MDNVSCELVRDLLPLYADGVCSEASRACVDRHIAACPACASYLRDLQSDETTDALRAERDGVIGRQAAAFRRKSTVIGAVFAAVLALPLLICLIVVLAVGDGFGWFSIVLASLLTAASLIVLPFFLPRNRFVLTLAAFTASLLLLLGVCALCTHGDWFFVAGSATLFGLCVVFSPFVSRCHPLRDRLGRWRIFAVLGADTLLFALMMLAIGFYTTDPDYARTAFSVALPATLLVWLIVLLFRVLPGALSKIGAGVTLVAAADFFSSSLVALLLHDPPLALPLVDLRCWTAYTSPGNLDVIGMIAGLAALVCGLILSLKRRKKA